MQDYKTRTPESAKWLRGRVSKSFSFAGYDFTEAVYEPDARLSPHSHDFVYFRYVLSGNFTEYYGKSEALSKPTTMMFRCSDESHSNHFYTETRSFTIKLQSQHFEDLLENQKVSNDTAILSSAPITRLFTRLYKELYTMDQFSEITIKGLMLEIIAETLRGSSKKPRENPPPRWLLLTQERLKEEFKLKPSIESLAKEAGVGQTYLAGEFRRFFNTTIGDYIRHQRIEFARQKLIESDLPISEIALATGFFDQSHFTRVFKKSIGMTPAAYRTTLKSH